MTSGTSAHRQTWDQIPWIVNGTVSESELRSAESHLQGCADCREELEFQRCLATSMAPADGSDREEVDREQMTELGPQRGWQRLRARLETAARNDLPAPAAPPRSGARVGGHWTSWLVAAMVVQALGLGVLGTMLWSRSAPPVGAGGVYRTLSEAEAPQADATIRVVFAPDTSVGRMQELLKEAGLQAKSGPSSEGVWSLAPARTSNRSATQSALRELRADPQVRFAEAVGGAP
jgi:hypothetical protein